MSTLFVSRATSNQSKIGHHILNYDEEAKPLFHKAILESGAPTSRGILPYNAKLHEDQFEMFINNAGCFRQPKHNIIPCLRVQRVSTITKAMALVFEKYRESLRWPFQPVIDGEIIRGQPVEIWKSGKWNKVPILTGYAVNEGTTLSHSSQRFVELRLTQRLGTNYIPQKMSSNEDFATFWRTLVPHYPSRDLRTIMRTYTDPQEPESPFLETRDMKALKIGSHFKRAEAAYADYAYICPVHHTATTVSSSVNAPPVWVYEWALNSTVKGGANHGDNMQYETFQEDITSISETQREVSGMCHAYITSFITSGDPNKIKGRFGGRPKWEQYHKGSEKVMAFGQGNDERAGGVEKGIPAQMEDTEPAADCQIWWKKMSHYE
jgi:acetylcholinesterase